MKPKQLRIGEGFSVDAQSFITQATGVVGVRGRGKTGAVKRIAEELHRVKLPFIIVDVAGIHGTIKSSGDGKGPGLPIVVFGGKYQDFPLNPRAGAEVAKAIIENNFSAVIDLKVLSKTDCRRFVTDFANEFFVTEGAPRVIILEEAVRLVPQKLYDAGMKECYGAVEKLVTQGRNEGIGVVMVAQRPAMINKDVLSEVDSLYIFGLVSPQDRKAIKEWVEVHGDADKLKEFDAGIAGLQQRECWVWNPTNGIFRKIHVLPFHTLHGDKTHLRKMGLLDVQPVTADVSEIIKKIGAKLVTIQQDKITAKDAVGKIRQLTAQVQQLTRDRDALAKQPKADGTMIRDASRIMDLQEQLARVSQQRDYQVARAKALEKSRQVTLDALVKIGRQIGVTIESAAMPEQTAFDFTPSLSTIPKVSHDPKRPAKMTMVTIKAPAPVASAVRDPKPVDDGLEVPWEKPLLAGERKMLHALVAHAKPLTRSQLALIAGMAPSGGGFGNYMGSLQRRGLIAKSDSGEGYMVTDQGRDICGPVESIVTHEQIVDEWRNRLLRGERLILDAVLGEPEGLSREEMATAANMASSGGGFGNYIGHLTRLGLIERGNDGRYWPAESLWP